MANMRCSCNCNEQNIMKTLHNMAGSHNRGHMHAMLVRIAPSHLVPQACRPAYEVCSAARFPTS